MTTASYGPAALAIMGIGAGMDIVGTVFGARSKRSQLKFEASIAEQNAQISEMAARSATEQGIREQQAIRLRAAKLKSSQRVAMAANGIALNEGNALDIQTETDLFAETDANMAAYNAAAAAWGYKTQAQQQRTTARANRVTADGISPTTSGVTSLISGATSVASNWYQLNELGAFEPKKKE